jgi:hypothetical protein
MKDKHNFDQYFKTGISKDYILLRDDFPLAKIAPGVFTRLIKEMFGRNDAELGVDDDVQTKSQV